MWVWEKFCCSQESDKLIFQPVSHVILGNYCAFCHLMLEWGGKNIIACVDSQGKYVHLILMQI